MANKTLLLLKIFTIATMAFASAQATAQPLAPPAEAPIRYECGDEELVADLHVIRGWRERFVVSEEDGNSVFGRTTYTRVTRIYCKGHNIRYEVGGGYFFSIFTTAEVVPHLERGQFLRAIRLQRTPYRTTGRGYYFSADFD